MSTLFSLIWFVLVNLPAVLRGGAIVHQTKKQSNIYIIIFMHRLEKMYLLWIFKRFGPSQMKLQPFLPGLLFSIYSH